jgi:hypothetical protein
LLRGASFILISPSASGKPEKKLDIFLRIVYIVGVLGMRFLYTWQPKDGHKMVPFFIFQPSPHREVRKSHVKVI